MFSIHVDTVGDAAVIECEGRIVRSAAAFELRDAVIAQQDVRVIVLDLSRVSSIEGEAWACCGICSAGPAITTSA
jgi:anti-anti-sigma regulatory factor